MEGVTMGYEEKSFTDKDFKTIGEYITKNYKPLEKDREEDEIQQEIDELEDSGHLLPKRGTNMSIMTSLPAKERVFVTINDMAKILGIGDKSIRRLIRENPDADYIYRVGNRTYLKKEMFVDIMLHQSTL